MRLLRYLLPLVYAAATVVQYNDPDTWIWVAIYGLATVLASWDLFGAPPAWLKWLTCLWALVWAGMWLPGVLTTGAITFDEEQRELGGLLIVAAGMATLALRRRTGADRGA